MGADNMAREIDGGHINRGPLRIGNILGRGISRTTDAPSRGQTITIPKPVSQPDVVIRPQEPELPPQPPTKPNLKQRLAKTLKQVAEAKATKAALAVVESAVAIGSPFAAQHHRDTHEDLSPQGIVRDIGAIPSTAEKDFNLLLQKLGLRSTTEATPKAFDPDSDKPQEIKAGVNGNARPATPEEIREFINRVAPVFEEPKPGEQAPRVEMIFPVNPEKAQQVKVTRISLKGYSTNEPYYYDSQHIEIKGTDVPFYLPLVAGAKKVDVTACGTNGVITYLELTYHLSNEQPVHARVGFGVTDYAFTDVLKSIPTLDTGKSNVQLKDYPTKEFDLRQSPFLDLFHTTGSTEIVVNMGSFNPFGLSPSFSAPNGQISYQHAS